MTNDVIIEAEESDEDTVIKLATTPTFGKSIVKEESDDDESSGIDDVFMETYEAMQKKKGKLWQTKWSGQRSHLKEKHCPVLRTSP